MEPFVRIYGYIDPSSGKYILSAKTQSLVSSIINAGEFVGATTAFFIGDHFGRRGGLFISSALVCVGAIFQLAGDHLGLLIVGRLLLGMPLCT
jgi:MFS transporter, SP family, sugar:H+ symporter